jgi:hypothetical protein
MERHSTFAVTAVGKSFCPRQPVLSRRPNPEAAVGNSSSLIYEEGGETIPATLKPIVLFAMFNAL